MVSLHGKKAGAAKAEGQQRSAMLGQSKEVKDELHFKLCLGNRLIIRMPTNTLELTCSQWLSGYGLAHM